MVKGAKLITRASPYIIRIQPPPLSHEIKYFIGIILFSIAAQAFPVTDEWGVPTNQNCGLTAFFNTEAEVQAYCLSSPIMRGSVENNCTGAYPVFLHTNSYHPVYKFSIPNGYRLNTIVICSTQPFGGGSYSQYFCDLGYKPSQGACVVCQVGEVCPQSVKPSENLGTCANGTCPKGDPINHGTGNIYEIESDYTATGPFPLEFRRFYNSDSNVTSARMGAHWRSNYDQALVFVDATTIDAYRSDGKVYQFTLSGSSWSPDVDITDILTELTDGAGNIIGWRYTTAEDIQEDYNTNGQWVSVMNRAGLTQILTYDLAAVDGGDDNSATLDRVTGAFGRTLTLSYDGNVRIATVTDPAGQTYTYGYGANNNLISVTYPDATPADSTDNPTRIYHYENTSFPNALTGITDENGDRFATWGYDGQGRANHSEQAGGAGLVDIVYNADGSSTVTNTFGDVQTFHFEVVHGVVKTSQVEGDLCNGCGGGSYKNITYDANGFIASTTDFDDNVTTYVHDARGLETSRTEAVGTPEERTITTTWHAVFRLPLTITEPGKITTFTYDSQGRLLEHKEEAAP